MIDVNSIVNWDKIKEVAGRIGIYIFWLLLLGIIIGPFVPTHWMRLRPNNKALEAEVKANLHTIQIAVERYHTDQGDYPPYLLGGDVEGWAAWHEQWDGVNDIEMVGDRMATNDLVVDPLIDKGYIVGYPSNPFVDDGRSVILRTNVEGSRASGHGDPRFGFRGTTMGMGLDDMNWFRGANYPGDLFFWSEIETRRTLDHGDWMNVPAEFRDTEPWNTDMYYLMGGFCYPPDPETGERRWEQVVYTYWPGNFFYKATSEILYGCYRYPFPNVYNHTQNRFILGCYGAENTTGMDVIRLIWFNPSGDRLQWIISWPAIVSSLNEETFHLGYELTEGSFGESIGLPEVFGGGNEWTGPCYPYNCEYLDAFKKVTYGAPDGIPDGVILVLTDSSNQ